MQDVSKIIRELFSSYDERDWGVTFDQLGVDSFDLMELRVRLEQATEHNIADGVWVSCSSFRDIQRYYLSLNGAGGAQAEPRPGLASHRTLSINMPQMVLGGLSEHWLFKELGDMHWTMVCDALDSESHNLLDELGNRLYATFVRLRLENSHHLREFRENERLDFEGGMSRFGKSMFFSDISGHGDEKEIRASLMTTFSVRQSDNKSLMKGEPRIPAHSRVVEKPSMPQFGEDYREMRKGNKSTLDLSGENFPVGRDVLFEMDYRLNPYQDMNGVNLLYFAAYPTISDVCETEFIHRSRRDAFKKHWAAESSTLARDVFYYGNCDLDDGIVFQVNSFEFVSAQRVKLATSLLRKSDLQLIANIFTLKALHG